MASRTIIWVCPCVFVSNLLDHPQHLPLLPPLIRVTLPSSAICIPPAPPGYIMQYLPSLFFVSFSILLFSPSGPLSTPFHTLNFRSPFPRRVSLQFCHYSPPTQQFQVERIFATSRQGLVIADSSNQHIHTTGFLLSLEHCSICCVVSDPLTHNFLLGCR